MAHVVFILGAGASKQGGCPVMSDFIETSRALALDSPDSPIADAYRAVMHMQKVLSRANSKTHLDFDNIESLLCSLEMAELMGGIAGMSAQDVSFHKTQLLMLIALTLDQTQVHRLQWTTTQPHQMIASGPADHAAIASFISSLRSCRYKHAVDVITFNYDIGLEVALGSYRVPYTYSLKENDSVPPDKNGKPVRLCKLHGSLSWVNVARNGAPEIRQFSPYDIAEEQATRKGTYPNSLKLDSGLGRLQLLSKPTSTAPLPFIVPPGEGKSAYRSDLRHVWTQAGQALADAEVLYVSGYSFPKTDTFFRQLIALGLMSDTVMRRVVINNPDAEAAGRISELLGPNITTRAGVLHRDPSPAAAWFENEARQLGVKQFIL